MKIIITVEYAIDNGVWNEVADLLGYHVYAPKEGMDIQKELCLTKEQALELGLI